MLAFLHFCIALLIIHCETPVAWGKLKISLKDMVTAGSKGKVEWNRDPDDPKMFYVVKFLHKNGLSPSEPFPVDATETTGTFKLPFINSGKFHLAAFEKLKPDVQPLAFSKTFNVAKPQDDHESSGSDSSNSKQQGNSTLPLNLPTPSSSVIYSSPTPDHINSESRPFNTPLVIGVIVGSLLGALVGLLSLYYFLHRRRRKVPDYPFAPPTMQGSSSFWRRFWSRGETGRSTSPATLNMSSSSITLGAPDAWDSNRNFYKTPNIRNQGRSPSTKKSVHPSGPRSTAGDTNTSLSSIRFSPNTERQMEIEERIEELTGKLVLLQRTVGGLTQNRTNSRSLMTMTHDLRILKWKNQIERLQELKNSDWAWGRTDVIPSGLYGSD